MMRNRIRLISLRLLTAFSTLLLVCGSALCQDLPEARSVEEVHKIPYEALFGGARIDLECVVICYEPDWAILFVHDGKHGLYAGGLHNLPIKTGDRIRIRGMLGTNRVPTNCTYEPSSNGIELPLPQQVRYEGLSNGQLDSQFVEIEAQLVGVLVDNHQTSLEMRSISGGRFRTLIHETKFPPEEARKKLGKHLRVRGTVGSRFDELNRWNGFQIWPGLASNIEEFKAEGLPETVPVLPIVELNADQILATKSSYFRTQGVVTCQISKDMVLLQDETHHLFVELAQAQSVELDRFYEVSGSLDTGIQPAILRMSELNPVDARFSVATSAVAFPISELTSGDFSGRLVRASGVYSGPFEVEGETGFFLRSADRMLPVFVTEGTRPDVDSGTKISVEGVWVQQKSLVGFNIGSCALYAREKGIQIGTQLPWGLFGILGIAASIAGLSFAWAVTLRRQVRRKTQEVLDSVALQRKTEEQYANIFINARVMVMTTDASGHITAVNPATVRQTKRSESELIGLHVTELVEKESIAELKELLSRAVASEERFSCEVRMLARSAASVPLEVNCWGTQHDQQTVLHLIWHDISERLRIAHERSEFEQQMVSLQKMESLGVLAGGIAHDFNNLLTVILGNASLLHSCPQLPSEERGSLESIQNAASRAAELTHQMLAYAGRGKFDVRNVKLSTLVQEMSPLMTASISRSTQLQFNLDSEVPSVRADATQLRQILMNLVLNASEAMEGKAGAVRIATFSAQGPPRSDVGTRCVDFSPTRQAASSDDEADRKYAVLEVSDEGIGMTEGVMERSLDPFFTTKFSGRGLGLSTVLGIVRCHHGCLQIQSEVGKGSRFRVYLPVDHEGMEVLTGPFGSDDVGQRTLHVLAVDDEPSILSLMHRSLEQSGIQVTQCNSASEALDVLRDGRSEIDCLVTDITMPGMDGIDLARAVQRLRPVPIILCSGFSVSMNQYGTELPAVQAFLKKPFASRELTRVVLQVIASSRSRSQSNTPMN